MDCVNYILFDGRAGRGTGFRSDGKIRAQLISMQMSDGVLHVKCEIAEVRLIDSLQRIIVSTRGGRVVGKNGFIVIIVITMTCVL